MANDQNNGRYQILRPLASGGMGELHLAREQGLEGFQRLVVLKRLRGEFATNSEFVGMFLDEARVLANVQHSNIVTIFDVGTGTDGYYYAMEFLAGQDLRKVVIQANQMKRRLPIADAVFVATSVLAGLHHAHERTGPDGAALSIVHRDVSLANVFITYDGSVKLLDFGIAKNSQQTTETRTGVIKGKFRYMSPEQCRTDPLDRRSDIYSLGVVLWEMTTGRGLQNADNDIKTLLAIIEREPPRPSSVVPDYPPELEAIVMRALSRSPQDRYQTAQEMQLALEAVALERRWPLSGISLSRQMHELFAAEIDSLALAQRGGNIDTYVADQFAERGRETPAHGATPSQGSIAIPIDEDAPPTTVDPLATAAAGRAFPTATPAPLQVATPPPPPPSAPSAVTAAPAPVAAPPPSAAPGPPAPAPTASPPAPLASAGPSAASAAAASDEAPRGTPARRLERVPARAESSARDSFIRTGVRSRPSPLAIATTIAGLLMMIGITVMLVWTLSHRPSRRGAAATEPSEPPASTDARPTHKP
jgi:serine/threonine protein kinase